jgi:hypothetical protein
VIGIAYAVSAAVAILVMSKATQETEHLKEMLVGNILSVTGGARQDGCHALVGVFHTSPRIFAHFLDERRPATQLERGFRLSSMPRSASS